MAEIVLNVEVRDRTGTGGARAARAAGKVPGVLYGGEQGPVPIAVNENAFRKALYTGRLLGRLVTLKFGEESQPVIAKDVQFHPATDRPVHFDLYRVGAHQLIRISIPVHFANQEESPGIRQGGSLEVVRHEIELMAPADRIPAELVIDLAGREIGDTIRMSDITLPEGVTAAISDRDFVVATLKVSSAALAEAADEAASGPAPGAEATPEA